MYLAYLPDNNSFKLYPISDSQYLRPAYNVNKGFEYNLSGLGNIIDAGLNISLDLAKFILGNDRFQICLHDPTYLYEDKFWVNNPFGANRSFVQDLVQSVHSEPVNVKTTSIINFKSII